MIHNIVQILVSKRKTPSKFMMILRQSLIYLILLNGCTTNKNESPNIIIILADDLGWRDTQAYGSGYYETPSINRLAQAGLTFTNAYAANPLCSPTRACLLTGLYASRLRFTTAVGHLEEELLDPVLLSTGKLSEPALTPQSRTRLPNEYTTYAEVFKEAGYRTAFMGKWHLGHAPYLPDNQGFDTVVGGRAHAGPPGPGYYFSPWSLDTLPVKPAGTHIADALTDEAIQFIADNKDHPFLLNLWYYDVHAPFQAEKDLVEKYQSKVDPLNLQKSPTMAAMIEKMDANIGRILRTLESQGLDSNTVVIFTSDNGGNMYDQIDATTPTNNFPLRGGKGINYEGGVRVPFIISWPGKIKGGSQTNEIISCIDLFPTLLEIADLESDKLDAVDGASFVNALAGGSLEERPVFFHFPHYVSATGNKPNTAVRFADWKMYRFYHDGPNQRHRYELYDLADDISEENNLAVKHPDIVIKLDSMIEKHLIETDALYPVKNPKYKSSGSVQWIAGGTSSLDHDEEIHVLHSQGNDPFVHTSSQIPATNKIILSFQMKSNSAGNAQFFWTNDNTHYFNQENSIIFQVLHDNRWHGYAIEIEEESTIRMLRFDPSTAPGEIRIRNIQFQDSMDFLTKNPDFVWTSNRSDF